MSIPHLYSSYRSAFALRKYTGQAPAILREESALTGLTDTELKAKFQGLTERNSPQSQNLGFALVREAAKRALGMRLFDVQVIGGLALLDGKLAEMQTGEGKTLTIVAPAALLALNKRGVHVVTANSYLATRDAELMRPVYEFLGLTVAAVDVSQTPAEKRAAYNADVTYGVSFEFGFDYLRDNLVRQKGEKVQRGLVSAIVDEVDSVLIDEARTPLIISGAATSQEAIARTADTLVRNLELGVDFIVEPKERTSTLTEVGYSKVEASLDLFVAKDLAKAGDSLYATSNLHLVRRIHASVLAHGAYRRDRDYVVEAGQVLLIDPGTGRKMPGRRLEDGLHEAIEAKEGVVVNAGSITRATITYQNFYGLYEQLAGLTGTAITEAEEFNEFYQLETVQIPTNKPLAREALEDLVFRNKADKFRAVVAQVQELQLSGQPVLAGCASVRDAEVLSQLLTSQGIQHEVLTAKYLEREAEIVSNAGRLHAVTVTTNMAGRGTDILLGGPKPRTEHFATNEDFDHALSKWGQDRNKVLSLGGLFVLGTERSGVRRVDNQLAGRAGRQGDAGKVQFVLSLEDELLGVFGQTRQHKVASRLMEASGGALRGKVVNSLVTSAQKKVEGQGFDARKSLMKFDGVLASQRAAVFTLRDELLENGVSEYCQTAIALSVDAWVRDMLPLDAMSSEDSLEDFISQADVLELKSSLNERFSVNAGVIGWVHSEKLSAAAFAERVQVTVFERFAKSPITGDAQQELVFNILADLWSEHLTALDELRQSSGLKSISGQNPVYQFGKDAYALFVSFESALVSSISTQLLSETLQTARAETERAAAEARKAATRVAVEAELRWIARNEPCPCMSGLAYKRCHGKL